MNLKLNLSVWLALLGTLSFVSCAKDPATEISPLSNLEENQKELIKIPYANKSDLEQFSSNEKIVDYNLSRKMALVDLQDFKKDVYQNKHGLKLSEFPVIIYDNDNSPKYYEFIVLENGKEIGTITSFAKKEVPGFTAYVLPFVRNYSDKNATKYSDVYPYSSENDNAVTSLSAKKSLSEEVVKIQQEAKEFWESIDNPVMDNQPNTALIRAWNEEYIIPEFNNDALLRTRWSGACAPAALAWLYRAYHTTYKGIFYPLHGAPNNTNISFGLDRSHNVSLYWEANPLYRDLAEKCRVGYGMDPFKDATLPKDMKNAVNDIFPNHKLEGGSPISIGKARRSIEGNNPTVLLMRSGWQLHYVVGFGTKNRYNTYRLWLFKIRKVHTDSWVRVSDNGATTKKENYLPYYINTHAILGKDFVTYTLYRK